MTHTFKTVAVASVLAASGLYAGAAAAELTANVGVTSNYIFRGETQSGDVPAISGGIDYAHDSGFYAGTWTSSLNADLGYELDLYTGFAGEAGGLGYDIGVISFQYPKDVTFDIDGGTGAEIDTANRADFNEVYLGLSYGAFTAKYSFSDDYLNMGDSGSYFEVGADFDVKEGLILGLHAGYKFGDVYDNQLDGSYADYSVSLSKGDFTFAVTDTDEEKMPFSQSKEPRVVATWSTSFDL